MSVTDFLFALGLVLNAERRQWHSKIGEWPGTLPCPAIYYFSVLAPPVCAANHGMEGKRTIIPFPFSPSLLI